MEIVDPLPEYTDGRIRIRCKVCGGVSEVAIYRYFSCDSKHVSGMIGSTHHGRKLLIDFFRDHANCTKWVTDCKCLMPTPIPDFEFFADE